MDEQTVDTNRPYAEDARGTRRRFLALGGVAASAATVTLAGIVPSAHADPAEGLDLLKEAPVNVALRPEWGNDPESRGTALAEALSFASLNGFPRVYAPEGDYEVQELSIPAGIHLFGAGPETRLLCPGDTTIAVRFGDSTTPSGSDACLSDLSVVGDQSDPIGGQDEDPPNEDPPEEDEEDEDDDEEGEENNGAIAIHSSNCRVERVSVITPRSTGISITGRARNAKVIDCQIHQPLYRGVHVTITEVTAESDIEGLEIRGNLIDNSVTGYEGIVLSRRGNLTWQWISPRITDNVIHCSPIKSAQCIEIHKGGSRDAVVARNSTTGGSMGISISRSDGAAVIGNTVRGARVRGIEIAASNMLVSNRPNVRTTVVGNTIHGRTQSDGYSSRGISVSAHNDAPSGQPILVNPMQGAIVNGNVVIDCLNGIRVSQVRSAVINGNYVQCPSGGTYDESDSAGIALRTMTRHGVVGGNTVRGGSSLPFGIRIHNAWEVTCVGNNVRECSVDQYGTTREIFVETTSPTNASDGNGTAGAVVANAARVVMSAAHGGAVEDLRTGLNDSGIETIETDASRLIVPGTPEVVKVSGSGVLNSMWNFRAGNSPKEERNYTGRVVTLIFTSALRVNTANGDWRNIDLASSGYFTVKPGDTLTVLGDGTGWKEISRSVN